MLPPRAKASTLNCPRPGRAGGRRGQPRGYLRPTTPPSLFASLRLLAAHHPSFPFCVFAPFCGSPSDSLRPACASWRPGTSALPAIAIFASDPPDVTRQGRNAREARAGGLPRTPRPNAGGQPWRRRCQKLLARASAMGYWCGVSLEQALGPRLVGLAR